MSDFPEQYSSFAEWRRKDPEAFMRYANAKEREAGMKLRDRPSHAQNGTAAGQNENHERNERDASAGASGQNENNENNERDANTATPLYPSDFYDCLPPTLKAITNTFTEDRERAVFMAGALPVIAGACPSVLLRYGGQWVAPNLYVIPVAPAGAGKGPMRHSRRMGEPINRRLIEESNEARKEWRDRRNDEEAEAGPEPPLVSFYLAGDSSAAGLKEDLEANPHGVISEAEIRSATTAMQQDWGDYRDVLLKGCHNEPLMKKRKGKEPIHIPRPALSVALSGTPHSFKEIIRDAEDGLFSRCNFLFFAGDDEFKDVFADENDDALDAALKEAGEQLDSMRKKLEKRGEPLYVKAADREREMIVKAGKKAFSKVKVSELGDFFLSSVKRSALTAFRVAGLLRLLRLAEDDKPLDSIHSVEVSAEDVYAGLIFAMTSLTHAAYLSGRLRKENRTGGLNVTQKSFFGALPTGDFTTAKAKEIAAGFGFTDRTAENYLYKFADRGMIDDVGHGQWSKPDFSSDSFLSSLSSLPTAPASESNEAGCQNESHESAHESNGALEVSFGRGDRVETPEGEGAVVEVLDSGRVAVKLDDGPAYDETQVFDLDKISEVS